MNLQFQIYDNKYFRCNRNATAATRILPLSQEYDRLFDIHKSLLIAAGPRAEEYTGQSSINLFCLKQNFAQENTPGGFQSFSSV